jgi:hypothetical protein
MIADRFEYIVCIGVLLTVEEAKLLKLVASSHYDSTIRHAAVQGVINGLFNTATWAAEDAAAKERGEDPSPPALGHPCTARDLDTCIKALEMVNNMLDIGAGAAAAALTTQLREAFVKIHAEHSRLYDDEMQRVEPQRVRLVRIKQCAKPGGVCIWRDGCYMVCGNSI